MALNNQEDVVKLTEKCGLSSTGSSSPVVTPLRIPEDLKSNILKAQAEAAALKGPLEEHAAMVGDKNCNLQDASASLKVRTGPMGSNSSLSVSRPDVQEPWNLLKPASLVSSAGTSAERLAEDLNIKMPSESASEAMAPKGLEVSKPGRYQALPSDNFLEMSDSAGDFTASGLPLDSDTDAAMTYASHKPLLNAVFPTAVTEGVHSDSMEATIAPPCDLSASRTPDSAMSGSPDDSLCAAVSPGTACRGIVGSDSAKAEGGAESGEAGQKEGSAQAPETMHQGEFSSSWFLYSNKIHYLV